jgi:hypothetical protein
LRPAAALTLASSSSLDTASAAFVSSASALSSRAVADQGLRQPQPHQRDRLLTATDVQPGRISPEPANHEV